MRLSRGEYQALVKKAAGVPFERRTKSHSHANRGQALEHVIDLTNRSYYSRRVAVINKVPTAWIPIRGHDGTIVSAKVDQKSIVDFTGRYERIPVAFDCKESHDGRMRWDRVEPHQEHFLDDWTHGGAGIGFILASFSEKETFVIPWHEWKSRLEAYRGGGSASFTSQWIPKAWAVAKYDYLETLDKLLPNWR